MSLQERLKEIFDSALNESTFPGYSAAIVTPSEIVTFFGGNHTYDEMSPPITKDTLYDVASLTKIVGPMALLMQLVDDGTVSLDDKVTTYLPEVSSGIYKEDVTIRNLLTYTLEYVLPAGDKKAVHQEMSPEELATNTFKLSLKSPPGTSYFYSNITAFLITQLVEKVTNRNFYELVQEAVLKPCNMVGSTFFPDEGMKQEIPPTEVTDDRGIVQGFVHDESTYYFRTKNISSGAAGLFSTAHDIASFMSHALSFTNDVPLFSQTLQKEFVTNQFPTVPQLTPLGWGDSNNEYIAEYRDRFVVKSGFTGCFIIGDVRSKIGVVILSNSTYPIRPKDRTAFNQIKKEIIALLVDNKN